MVHTPTLPGTPIPPTQHGRTSRTHPERRKDALDRALAELTVSDAGVTVSVTEAGVTVSVTEAGIPTIVLRRVSQPLY